MPKGERGLKIFIQVQILRMILFLACINLLIAMILFWLIINKSENSGVFMLYLILDIQSTAHTDECSQLNAWVNVHDNNEAIALLSEELSLQGWAVTNVVESQSTEASDYFPPCKSYDAFKEASSGLFALRFE